MRFAIMNWEMRAGATLCPWGNISSCLCPLWVRVWATVRSFWSMACCVDVAYTWMCCAYSCQAACPPQASQKGTLNTTGGHPAGLLMAPQVKQNTESSQQGVPAGGESSLFSAESQSRRLFFDISTRRVGKSFPPAWTHLVVFCCDYQRDDKNKLTGYMPLSRTD